MATTGPTCITLCRRSLRREDLGEFVACYNPANQHARSKTLSTESPDVRWRHYGREQLLARDKAILDLFWLKDKSFTDLDNLPEPEELAEAIIENFEAGLESLRSALAALRVPTETNT